MMPEDAACTAVFSRQNVDINMIYDCQTAADYLCWL
jgi:hypothetical protein